MSSEVYALARLRALRALLADLRFSFDGVPASAHAPATWTQRPARVQPTAGASVVASWLIGGSMSPSPSALDSTVSQSFEVAVYVATERAADVQAVAAQVFEAVAVALRDSTLDATSPAPSVALQVAYDEGHVCVFGSVSTDYRSPLGV
ncbi:MAG: hypothetical protein EBZ78_05155 [Verrucomicrobia bacterium]|nr:hypothetical protein [Verrucomicrobiota bacterium]